MAPKSVQSTRTPQVVEEDEMPLADLIVPGDVLYIKGEPRLFEVGVAGGSFGHVVLVTGRPQCIVQGSAKAHRLQAVFPLGVSRIWSVATAESTSREEGLYQSELLLYVGIGRRVLAVGEHPNPRELVKLNEEVVEIWQSPAELRSQLRTDITKSVVDDMKAHEANWSMFTAAKAFLRTASISKEVKDRAALLQEVQQRWFAAPICTSIVIIFWQRYLCSLAGSIIDCDVRDPLDLVLRWMPVKADQTLPSDLLGTMQGLGWNRLDQIPRNFPIPSSFPAKVSL